MTLIIGLLVAGAILLLLEIVLPGGVIGLLGLVFLLTGVVFAFVHDLQLGLSLLLALLLLAPPLLWAWIHYFPKSRFAKPLTLATSAADWQGFDKSNAAWLDKVGVATSDLRPSGIATIDEKRVDVVSDGRLIDRGTSIRVIAVEGNRIIVAPESNPLAAATNNTGASQP